MRLARHFLTLLLLGPFILPASAEAFVLYPEPPAGRFVMNLDLLPTEPFQTVGYGSQSWNSLAEMALATWNQVGIGTGLDHYFFQVRSPSVTGDPCNPAGVNEVVNEVRWSSSLCGKSFGTAIAYTMYWYVNGVRTEAHVLFDNTQKWNAYSGPLQSASGGGTLYDFVRVAVHEFGHVAGLDHPDEAGQTVQAIMNSQTSDIDTLQPDDINGAHAINWTPPKATLSASVIGSGGVTSSPAGLTCSSGTCSADFVLSTVVTLTAVGTSGTAFTGWSGDCTGMGTCELTMDAAKSVTATFSSQTFTLTVTKAGAGTGTVTGSPGLTCGEGSSLCAVSFLIGQGVTLTATPASGSTFTSWSGEGCAGTGHCIVTMTQARNVTATFGVVSYSLSVSIGGSSSGSVSSNPAGINACRSTCSASYTFNTGVTLTASADAGGTFRMWRGDPHCEGSSNPTCSLTANAAKRVTAVFTKTFTDTTVTTGSTPVKAVHFTELGEAINTLRGHYNGLGPFAWSGTTPAPGWTVTRLQVLDLRKALDDAYYAAGSSHTAYTDTTLNAGSTPIRAIHLSDLRKFVGELELMLGASH